MGKPFDNRSLANTWLTNQNRVVLGAARKNLHHAFDLALTPDYRVEFAFGCGLGQVLAILVEHLRTLLLHNFAADVDGLFAFESLQHLLHGGAHLVRVSTQLGEHLSGNAFAFF